MSHRFTELHKEHNPLQTDLDREQARLKALEILMDCEDFVLFSANGDENTIFFQGVSFVSSEYSDAMAVFIDKCLKRKYKK